MGGKTKQRTKNNVRPSSSGRSAELLATGLKLEGGTGALFPTLAGAGAGAGAMLDASLSPEFALCFKKLNKKDPITKTKALVELSELVGRSEVEAVAAALPAWARHYRALAVDADRRVRDAAQACHGAVVGACGRRAAPCLRQLVPAWLCSQYDDHAPAQAKAHLSLTSTFPESKLPEVLWYCREEVLDHLQDGLEGGAGAGAGAGRADKAESAEESAAARARLAASALQGLQYVVRRLPDGPDAGADAWLRARIEPLLRAPAFWKLAAHVDPVVRAAWYKALGCVAARLGASAFDERLGAKAARLVVGAREPAAPPAPALWGCLLQLMLHVPDWYKWLDNTDLLRKRILDVLEAGGWGDARRLADVMPRALAHLPPDLRTHRFYEEFLAAALTGLEHRSVMSSRSERQAWVGLVAECLRLVSAAQRDAPAAELLTAAHRRWLEAALAPRPAAPDAHLVRHSAAAMAQLAVGWLRQPDDRAHYDRLVRNFWQNVGSTVLAQVDRAPPEPAAAAALVDAHAMLLRTLRTGLAPPARRHYTIKFDDDAPAPAPPADDRPPAPAAEPCDAPALHRYMHNLNEAVEMTCSRYLELARDERVCEAVVAPLVGVLREWDTARVLAAAARRLGTGSLLALYQRELRGWLAADGHAARSRAVVDLVFLLMEHLADHERDEVFDSFDQLNVSSVVWCVQVCAAHPARAWAATRRWLRGPAAHSALAALARRAPDDAPARDLLLLCLAHTDHDEMLISEATLTSVVGAVSARVCEPSAPAVEARTAFAAQLASALAAAGAGSAPAAPAVRDAYVGLLLNLFRLNLALYRGSGALSAGTWCDARAGWQDALAALPAAGEGGAARERALRDAAALMHHQLYSSMDTLDIVRIDHIASLCPYLLRQCDAARPPDAPEAARLARLLLALPAPPAAGAAPAGGPAVELCALRHDCIASNLNCPFDDDNEHMAQIVREAADEHAPELTKDTLLLYVHRLLFRGACLRALLGRGAAWGGALLREGGVAREVAALVHDYCVLSALHDGYAFWAHYDIIQETKRKLDLTLEEVVRVAGAEGAGAGVLAALTEAAARDGYYWACARQYYAAHAPPHPADGDGDGQGEGQEELLEALTGNGYFHSLQANLKWCTDGEAALRTKYEVMVRSVQCAHAHEPLELARAALAGRAACSLDVIVDAYYQHNHIMLYDTDVCAAPWRQVVSNAAVAEFLAELVAARGWELPARHWDFANIALCSLLASLRAAGDRWTTTKVSLLTRSVLRVFCAAARWVRDAPAALVRREPPAHVPALLDEWRDVFAPDASHNIYSMIVHVLECGERDAGMCSARAGVVSALLAGAPLAAWERAPAAARAGPLAAARVAGAACRALARPDAHHAYKYLAHAALSALADPLVLHDAEQLAAWGEAGAEGGAEEGGRPQFALEHFRPALEQLQELVDTALAGFQAGEDTCEMAARSDSHGVALGYLLLCDALHRMHGRQHQDLTHHYIELFREHKYGEVLLTASLRLLPARVAAAARAPDAPPAPPAAHRAHQDMFLATQQFDVYECCDSCVPSLACRGVWHALAGWGRGAARSWWGAAPARAARSVQRLARLYVAPQLVREQMQRVHERAHELPDTQITVHWSAGEVVCVYTVEERPLELAVGLPRDHPLSAPAVRAPPPHRAAPAPSAQWIALYLTYQNGSVLNALKMWTSAVSARVSSAPQCYICYCRLQPATGRLPAVPCHQCNNKFHTECLRKWFTSSNKSNCPLCRATF